MEPDNVLLDRLLCDVDPFWSLGWESQPPIEEFLKYSPIGWIKESDRPQRISEYDWRRVCYFIWQVKNGKPLDPITIDCVCYGLRVLPQSTVIDGNHRLCAANLTKQRLVKINFSGRVDLLEWLKGETNVKPEY